MLTGDLALLRSRNRFRRPFQNVPRAGGTRPVPLPIAASLILSAVLLTAWEHHAVVSAQTGTAAATNRLVPPILQDTSWLQTFGTRRSRPLAGVAVFHDFQFTDRVADERHHVQAQHRRRRREDLQGGALRSRQRHRDCGCRRRRPARHLLRQPGRRQSALEEPRRRQVRGHHGVGRRGVPGKVSVSASFADIDNDGDPDLYVTTVRGGNVLFENDGHGHFRDISAASGLGLRRPLLGRGVLRLRPRRPARSVPGQRRTVHDRHDRRRGAYRYYVAFEDAFSGHLKPERAERSILYHNEGGNRFVDVSQRTGLHGSLLVRRRERGRRQRRRLAGSVRAEHAGRRPVLRERRRQARS